ncbi:kinase-like domain-containing protein [Rhizophagus irregularis DAOM 181602=DAOM 197198]|nr:kinase-like domain-containing protein [Rhizophagus irregularis DAOM 181602=DAOM 197198]
MSQFGICEECNQENTDVHWCKACNAKWFQQNFKNWTSGNNDIDKFIQDTQLSAIKNFEVLEWIPYNKFYDIEYIAKGGFGKVYRAKWIDGYIKKWDNENQNWRRNNLNIFVALKSLNNSENVTLEFINEIKLHNKIGATTGYVIIAFGITQDPETKNYMMVLEYAEDGSLRNYLNKSYSGLNWEYKLRYLYYIAEGLIIRESESAKNKIYGVLPYIAPEILRGQNYTKASDIYSFGIIMYEVISGLPPYHDVSHDINLSIKICQGLRPRFNIKVPQLIIHLIKRCLDANPLDRPTANEIDEILDQWYYKFKDQTELQKQIKEAVDNNNSLPTSSIPSTNLGLTYETHSEAVYTSRLLNFNNLPEPKNTDDYYDERNDNIISEKFSESLQINISQLKISDANETKNGEEMIE